MIERLDTHPHVAVSDAEYLRLLGYPPGHVTGHHVDQLMAWARSWFAAHGRPWVYMREATLEHREDALRLDGVDIHSGQLRDHLRSCSASRAVVVAVSAGNACEAEAHRLWQDSRPDEYFFLEVMGAAVVENLVASLSGLICDAAGSEGFVAVPHYSPGYAGWDVAEQEKLFGLIARGPGCAFPEPLEVLASGMLRPKKSLLAVVGLAPRTEASPAGRRTPCEVCAFAPCSYRRSAYRHVASRIDGAPAPTPAIVPNYTVNTRALRKWAQERTRLETRDDGTIAVAFRFDGTTCSNMGRPLAFDYRVVVGPAGQGHTILEAECRPAEGDTGHTHMCAYQADAGRLMEAIAAEKPLLGRPMDAVLSWRRDSAPSGCLCEARSRAHKWGLALEVMHFALANAHAPGPSALVAR